MKNQQQYQITYILPFSRKVYYVHICSNSIGASFTLNEKERKVYNTHEEAKKDLDTISVKNLTMAGCIITPIA